MLLRRLLLLTFFSFAALTLTAQVHLRITSLSRFPVAPTDTAYEASTYDSVMVQVENIGNTVLFDNVSIFLQTTSNLQNLTDTIYSDTSAYYNLPPNQPLIITADSYRARPIHFDDGDNIVVVWPAARLSSYTCDTLTFNVYFVRINGIEEPKNDPIKLGPNPTSDYLVLDFPAKNSVKQVRIIDILGKEIYSLSPGQNYISTTAWAAGIYFLESLNNDGTRNVRKIIKE